MNWVHPTSQPNEDEVRSSSNVSHSTFTIQTVDELGTIDTSITLFAVVCGRKHDVAFNTRIIRLVQKYELVMHLSLAVYGLSLLSLLCTTNQFPLMVVAIITGLIASLPAAAVLSWDIVCRVVRCFEFWYLTVVSWIFILTGFVVFSDVARRLGMLVVGIVCQVTFFIDASTYLRRYLVRMFMLGVPGLVVGALMTKFGLLPQLDNVPLIKGINLGAVDLSINSSITIALYYGAKALPSFRLIAPGETVKQVICELYYPVCQLVPVSSLVSKFSLSETKESTRQLNFIPILMDEYDVIDSKDTIVSQRTIQTIEVFTSSYAFMLLGWLGLISTVTSSVWHISMASTTSDLTLEQHALAKIGLMTTIVYVITCGFHYQRTLVYHLIQHFDMWFVAIQWAVMTLSASDRLSWDVRTLNLVSLWIWCSWILGLDALPPVHSKIQRYHQWLTKVVSGVLTVFPILLVYWIYCSGTPNITDNRVFYLKLYSYEIAITTSSFLSSKIPSVWMWMLRYLFIRPGSFRFIRRRIKYWVNLNPVLKNTRVQSIHPSTQDNLSPTLKLVQSSLK